MKLTTYKNDIITLQIGVWSFGINVFRHRETEAGDMRVH